MMWTFVILRPGLLAACGGVMESESVGICGLTLTVNVTGFVIYCLIHTIYTSTVPCRRLSVTPVHMYIRVVSEFFFFRFLTLGL